MTRIIDRYIVRSVLTPFFLSLLVFTFILILPFLIQRAEPFIAKGVPGVMILRVMLTLVPQALAVSIPMALLIGLLVGLGRLSGDREWVALQSCGVSLARILRPIVALAVVTGLATMYVMIWAVPDANQTFREITYRIVAQWAEGDVKPRVFFEGFPNRVVYVRERPATGGGWQDVFVADSTRADRSVVLLAARGRMVVDRERRTVDLVLEDGTQHISQSDTPAQYKVGPFGQVSIHLNWDEVFPRTGLQKGDREMTIAELQALIETQRRDHVSPHAAQMEIQKKFSIPFACVVFALLGGAFGLTSRRDGKMASFVQGIAVIFVYYVILGNSQSLAKGAWVPAWLATWIPNIILGALGLVLLRLRAAVGERSAVPGWLVRLGTRGWGPGVRARLAGLGEFARRMKGGPRGDRPRFFEIRPSILDGYIGRMYLQVCVLAFVGLLGIFQISTFIDLSDKLFKGTTTGAMLLQYMWYATPQYAYWCIPLAVLIGGLVTFGLLTRSSELIVMRACGISLYRSAAPLVLFAVVASGVLFAFEEQILAYSNRRAEALNHVIRGGSAQTFDVLNRKWIVGRRGDIYTYTFFDPRRPEFSGFSVFRFASKTWRLQSRAFYKTVSFGGHSTGVEESVAWQARDGWVREFDRREEERSYRTVDSAELFLEPPAYFATEQPDAARMNYQDLNRYIVELRASGFNVTEHEVELHRKVAFPWVTLIMTFMAVPFAVTTGRRGAMYGIGVGLVLALVYWVAMSVFAALGAGGVVAPILAAWAPNILFAAGAIYLLLTVRT